MNDTTFASATGGNDAHLPVRGEDAVEILRNDHTVIKQLLAELSSVTTSSERMAVLERAKAALTVHNATEENFVYPALALLAGKKWESERLYHETAKADMLVFELDTMLKEGDEAKFGVTAEALEKAVLEHIEDEETKAFPHLSERTEAMQQQMLTANVRQFRSALQVKVAV